MAAASHGSQPGGGTLIGQRQTWHNSLTVLWSEVASEPTDYSPMRTIKSSTFSNEDDLVQSSPVLLTGIVSSTFVSYY